MAVKKVLIYSLEYPPQVGGAGVFSYRLASGFSKSNIDVTVLTGSKGKKIEENAFDVSNDWKTSRMSSIKTKLWPLFATLEFLKIINSRFDLVIISNYTALLSLQFVRAKVLKDLNYKIVFHGRDYDYIKSKPFLRDRLIVRNKIFSVLKYSNEIVAVSNYLKKEMLSVGYFDESVKVIHHGIPKDEVLNIETKSFEAKSKFKIIAAGRLEKEKNFNVLIRAIETLNDSYNVDVELDIYGEGTKERELSDYIETNSIENIIINSKVSQKKLMTLYEEYDFIISLSEKETFGLIFIEAMSKGCIVVSYENGSIQEIVNNEHDGFIINSLDHYEIAKDLNKIIHDFDLNEVRRNASFKIKDKFMISQMVNEYIK